MLISLNAPFTLIAEIAGLNTNGINYTYHPTMHIENFDANTCISAEAHTSRKYTGLPC